MSYRPQFAYAAIADCDEQRCTYSFDASNTPKFVTILAAGAMSGRIPLKFDLDADFYVRAIEATLGGLKMRIEGSGAGDPWSDAENDTSLFPGANYERLAQYSATSGDGASGLVPIESGLRGIFVPGGGTVSVFLMNYTSGAIGTEGLRLKFHGVKAYHKGCGV